MGSEDFQQSRPELTLDPADWQSLRVLGHKMIDDIFDHLSSLHQQPAWQPMPDKVKENLAEPIPYQGIGAESVYQQFLTNILPYTNGNRHPRFWGWVQGNGIPLAMLADMLAAAMNPHMAGFNQAPVLVEEQVLKWLAELMGIPSASGLLTSGGTMANVTGLMVARHAKANFNLRNEGLQNNQPKLLFYGSTETHGWAGKTAELLGLGKNAFRLVPVDNQFRINLSALNKMIADDFAAGHRPFCVIGTAGTVNTAAIDDLEGLADICQHQQLWFHIDGAFGAIVKLVPQLQHMVRGLERADSIAFDLHKWLYLPFEIGCILVRDSKLHNETFAHKANYYGDVERGVIGNGLPFASRGIELTRGFKALKAWMTFKAYGIETFSQLILQNVEQAQYLAELINSESKLQLLAPVSLNIVCFRYKADGYNQKQLNELNQEILMRVQESGIAVPSSTIIDELFALRVAITNHRSRREDFQLLVDTVLRIGAEVTQTWR